MTSYNIFTKHAEKMLKKVSGSRPVLQGAYHQADGSVVATDSHRLYKLHNGYQTEQSFIQNLTTGNMIDGNYPDTSKLIPEAQDAQHSFMVNVKELHDAAKAMLTAHKAVNAPKGHITLSFTTVEDVCVLKAGSDSDKFQATCNVATIIDVDMNIHFQPSFLIDALALFKDAGETEIKVLTYGNMRPFILESKDVTALILPVRVY